MYLEGSDQHRGCFNRRCCCRWRARRPPYKNGADACFMVDADREKISKSKQGQAIYEKRKRLNSTSGNMARTFCGLWVASPGFRNDIIVSESASTSRGRAIRVIRTRCAISSQKTFSISNSAKHTVPTPNSPTRTLILASLPNSKRTEPGLRRLRVPRRVSKGQPVRGGGIVRHLPRRSEGPSLHRRGNLAAPPIDADRAASSRHGTLPKCSRRSWAFTTDEAWNFNDGKLLG